MATATCPESRQAQKCSGSSTLPSTATMLLCENGQSARLESGCPGNRHAGSSPAGSAILRCSSTGERPALTRQTEVRHLSSQPIEYGSVSKLVKEAVCKTVTFETLLVQVQPGPPQCLSALYRKIVRSEHNGRTEDVRKSGENCIPGV